MRIAIAGGTGVVGRYAVGAAEAAGHETVVLSRSRGIDVAGGGAALSEALAGIDVIVDCLNSPSLRGKKAAEFFVGTSRRLQEAGSAAGVGHIVTLSIVGLERVPGYGYYEAKLAQEAEVSKGPLPVTIVRATQFHEFPAQMLAVTHKGPVAMVPHMASQPVAARTVGEKLVDVAVSRPGGTVELAGPQIHDIAELAHRLIVARGLKVKLLPLTMPGKASQAMRTGALLATEGVTEIAGPTFDAWLDSDDAARVTF